MLELDHLTIIAPSLDEGVDYLRTSLDIDIGHGATHADMGTHNRRIRLGREIYLEVIAVNPNAPSPSRPRWFGLDRDDAIRSDWEAGLRLKAWVARTNDIDGVLAAHGRLLGAKTRLEDRFYFSVLPDGALPMGGVLPCVIDRVGQPPTATRIEEQGVQLREFVLEHPSPARIVELYDQLGVADPPEVREGQRTRFTAAIETPAGIRILS